MTKCERCGKTCRPYEMLTLSDNDGLHPETVCGDCYNKKIAINLGVKDFRNFKTIIVQRDCERKEHKFVTRKMIDDTGIFWEAVEFPNRVDVGYYFKVYQNFEDASEEAIKSLNEKIKVGLAKKFIKKTMFKGQERLTLSGDTLEGKIEWDNRYDGRIPKFKIDGQDYTGEQIGKLLMGHEGCDFELKIKKNNDFGEK